jgi:membrane peptidoglycan carboxypeptidase
MRGDGAFQRGWGEVRSRALGAFRRVETEDFDWLPNLPWIGGPKRGAGTRGGRPRTGLWILVGLLVIVVLAAIHEVRTSAVQAFMFSRWARGAGYSIEGGAGHDVLYPSAGVFDEQAGYTRLAEFRSRLEAGGFATVEQTRFSPALTRLVRWGLSPPFREPVDAGLLIRDAAGDPLFDFSRRRPLIERFEDIPLPVLRTLLYIEDRRLGEEGDPRRNPAVDWGRVGWASARYVGRNIGLPLRVEGGSTLATQIEKYRHSEGGRTRSVVDKLRQMTSASLKVYRDGPDTSQARRQVVLDYLNSMPLAAAAGHGEVRGLGEGLRVWFGVELQHARAALEQPGTSDEKARLYKQIVTLIYSVRAPSRFLVQRRDELATNVDAYLRLLRADGVVESELADRALAAPLVFPQTRPAAPQPLPLAEGKAAALIRRQLGERLGVQDLYSLDRLHVEAASTIDGELQQATAALFRQLADPAFVRANGLREERLLGSSDPARVVYSLLLVEAAGDGDLVRVHSDSYGGPFDVNSGMKTELGSTAKLRTLVHYLDLVAGLHGTLAGLDRLQLREVERDARDPITSWAAATMQRRPRPSLVGLLDLALDRTYSASPHERFFTGGGVHTFRNFDDVEDTLVLTVREAAVRSANLPFVRLMRDLVRYHEARLDYDARAALADLDDPVRRTMLEEIADAETTLALRRAWLRLHEVAPEKLVATLLGANADSARDLAIVYFAWHSAGDEAGLQAWLLRHRGRATPEESRRLIRSYGNRTLVLSDYAWLADLHPLDLWCAGRLAAEPGIGWDTLHATSATAREESAAWLFKTRNRRAQDLRLRTRIEQDAFEHMAAHWRRQGFPFARMVPSLASAIGSSADRPTALAELMGVLVNDGVRRPTRVIDEVRLAPGTPYYAALRAQPAASERVLPAEVARATRGVLADVVERGTARRLAGAFVAADGSVLVSGGKTGSGDNRRAPGQDPLNRTAAFVFYVGDRFYGVITASVEGPAAAEYRFTSSLPLAVLRLLAPDIARRAAGDRLQPVPETADREPSSSVVASAR